MSGSAGALIMGVVNVTPDSFSDGGNFFDPADAIVQARRLVDDGADIIDIGGESSRPGAEPVSVQEELRRVLPVVEAVAALTRVSIDTVKPEVARAGVAAGAEMINDISASLGAVAAELGAAYVAMHMQGSPRTMQAEPHYDDVVSEVHQFVLDRASAALAAGVTEVWVDPGIGFGKTLDHNLALLAALPQLVQRANAMGVGVAVGTSRKSFLSALSVRQGHAALAADDRHEGTLASTTWAIVAGAGLVRVHDVIPVSLAARLSGFRSREQPVGWVA